MPTRAEIKPQVEEKIAAAADEDPANVKEKHRLWEDLGLGSTVRKALGHPYTKISKKYGGKAITLTEAGKLKTVKQSIDLVHKRSNQTKRSTRRK